MDEEYIPISAAARRLNLSVSTVRQYLMEFGITHLKIPRGKQTTYLIEKASFESFLEKYKHPSSMESGKRCPDKAGKFAGGTTHFKIAKRRPQ